MPPRVPRRTGAGELGAAAAGPTSERGGAMGQQSLIYAFVARGTVVLAEYTDFTGNFTDIASQCLVKLPASNNNKFTYNCGGHTFNYLVHDGFTYCVVAVESVGQQMPIAFLVRIKDDFSKSYGGGKAATAAASSLNREFRSKLKEHMQYCVGHPEEINKLAKVQAQVSEVKNVMMENTEKVLDRGEKIELLVVKKENLQSQGTVHQASSPPGTPRNLAKYRAIVREELHIMRDDFERMVEDKLSKAGLQSDMDRAYHDITSIKEIVANHILNLINYGDMKKLTDIKNIGHNRAEHIIKLRSESRFTSLGDVVNRMNRNQAPFPRTLIEQMVAGFSLMCPDAHNNSHAGGLEVADDSDKSK